MTATRAPIVTCRCIFFLQDLKVICQQGLSAFFYSSLIVQFSLCPARKQSEKGKRVEVGPQQVCAEKLQGQLWFNPQRKGLYLCNGTVWIAVLEGEYLTFYYLACL